MIRYGYYKDASIKEVIESRIKGGQSILEVGAGRSPMFSTEFVNRHNLDYTILDISQDELDKAPPGYNTICADISNLSIDKTYDLIFSQMLAEHIKDGEFFHRNIFNLLSPGGVAIHYSPTLYAFPFVVNKLLPEKLSNIAMSLVTLGAHRYKFPAYYSWCKGPTKSQIRRLESLGYRIDQFNGYYGHSYYKKFPVLQSMNDSLSKFLVEHPIPQLCSYAIVVCSR